MPLLLTTPGTSAAAKQLCKRVRAVHDHTSCLPRQPLSSGANTCFGGTPVGFHGHAAVDDHEHGRFLNAWRTSPVYPSLTATSHLSPSHRLWSNRHEPEST